MTATARPHDPSRLDLLAALPAVSRRRLIEQEARKHKLSAAQMKALMLSDWRYVGRSKQQAPPGDWMFWWLLAGRGFGKTISAAQWAKKVGLAAPVRFALIGPTFPDVRDTMVEGVTGLLSVLPNEALLGQSREHAWNRSLGELELANGTKYKAFASERPDRLRGPQHHAAWCEEVSSWKDAGKRALAENTTWSNMILSTRLAEQPRVVVTSTPKANLLTRDLLKMRHMTIVRGSSYENEANLSRAWWEQVIAPLEGTRLGRQEIAAEVLEEAEGALWNRDLLDLLRVETAPAMSRLIVAVDPNTSSDEASNSAGIVVCGRGASDRHGYVLADRTIVRGGPRAWAAAAVKAYHDFEADRIVAEKNNGGEMVEITIHAYDRTPAVKLVSASRGKRTRAEPIATKYEGLEVHHVGAYPDLEDEMCMWTPEQDSPDRMDAMVWGMSELLLGDGSGEYQSYSAAEDVLPNIDPTYSAR